MYTLLKIPQPKLPLLRQFYKNKSGAVIVEMTLVIIPFILLFLYLAELCAVLYISVSIDLAMAEAMRFTTASQSSVTEYKSIFSSQMEKRIQGLPLLVYKSDKISFDTKYCALNEVATNTCTATTPSNHTPLAYYTIKYNYEPIFFFLPSAIINSGMTRKGIYIMENQRIRKQP